MTALRRYCEGTTAGGGRCAAAPSRGRPYCLFHDPERVDEAADARRLGGQRRRREGILAAAFDLDELGTIDGVARLVDVVVTDTLSLDNGIGRSRVLLAAAGVALRIIEGSDHEARLLALETQRRFRNPGGDDNDAEILREPPDQERSEPKASK
jgi:hypothetical protein